MVKNSASAFGWRVGVWQQLVLCCAVLGTQSGVIVPLH